jgi:4-amino-4-deoxy-L-arabinose transferase-like glycosyltransferase
MSDRGRVTLASCLVFLLALAVRLWYNFLTPHIDAAFACDAAEYLRDAQGFEKIAHLPLEFWSTACGVAFGQANTSQIDVVQGALSSLKELRQAGPFFPLSILLSFKLFGMPASLLHSFPPIAVQCILSSLTCVLIILIGMTLWSRAAGFTAGLIAVFYPGFIVNSGRLYSESFATFLSCSILLLLSIYVTKPPLSRRCSFLLGFLAALLHLTRSVMAVLSLLLVPLTLLLGGERKIGKLAYFLAGFAIVCLPWLFLQKCAFGRANLIIDRVGHYNFFTGNNPDTQGWLTFPYPDYAGIESKSYLRLGLQEFKSSPERGFKLMLDKPVRLLSVPWNDFKTPIGPFALPSQILFHQFLLLCAAVGVITSLYEKSGQVSALRRTFARFGLLAFFLFHLAYCAFITVPRYALLAIPCLILFAAAGLTIWTRHVMSKSAIQAGTLLLFSAVFFLAIEENPFVVPATKLLGENWLFILLSGQVCLRLLAYAVVLYLSWRLTKYLNVPQRTAAISALFIFITTLPAVSLPLRALGRWYEWSEPLNKNGGEILQSIRLDKHQVDQMMTRQSYLMVNLKSGAFLADDFKTSINGLVLDSFPIPAMSIAEQIERYTTWPSGMACPEVEYILNDITYFVGGFPLELRQWFLIPIDPLQLRAALALSKDDQSGQHTLRIRLSKQSDRPNSFYGAFRTDSRFMMVPSVTQFSWEKAFYSAENDQGLSDFALDAKVDLPGSCDDHALFSPTSEERHHPPHPYVRILVSPPTFDRDGLMKLSADSTLPELTAPVTGGNIAKTSLPKNGRNQEHIKLIRFTSKLMAKPQASKLSIGLVAELKRADGTTFLYPSLWFPQVVTPVREVTQLDYAFPIAPSSLSANLTSLTATISTLPSSHALVNSPHLSAKPKASGSEISCTTKLEQPCFALDRAKRASGAPTSDNEKIASGQLGTSLSERRSSKLITRANFIPAGAAEKNLRFRVYELPNNPLSPGHEIY